MRYRIHVPAVHMNRRVQFIFFVTALLVITVMAVMIFRQFVFAATATIVPDSTVSNNWGGSYTNIDEGITPTSDHINTGTALDAPTANFTISDLANVATVSSLELHVCAYSDTNANGGNLDTLTMRLMESGTYIDPSDGSFFATPAYSSTDTCTWYVDSFASGYDPQTVVNNLGVEFSRIVAGSGNPNNQRDDIRVVSAYVEVTYTQASQIDQASYRWFENDTASVSSDLSFQPKVDYLTSSTPVDEASADLNGDGTPDLVIANSLSDTLSVLLNNGDGTFQAKTDYASGNSPGSLAVADFDGDSNVDAAVANESSDNVSVHLGNGDGSFAAKVDYVAGSSPSHVATSDVSNDGLLDLIVTNSLDDTVSIFIGNGDGTFDIKVDYQTGNNPFSVTANDFNNDSEIDLAVANNTGSAGSVSILLGNGDGTFQPTTTYAGALNPKSITGDDFDGDGNFDLVTTTSSSFVSVYLGNGDGTFATKVDYAVGSTANDLISVDINADGKTDLATANSSADNISILLGNGDGTFQQKIDYSAGNYAISIVAGDFNNDGYLDMASSSWTDDIVSVFISLVNSRINVSTPLSAQDTAVTGLSAGTIFRLRLNLHISNGQLDANAGQFKLRYALRGAYATCNAVVNGNYIDVTDSSIIRYADNPYGTNGISLSVNANDPTHSTDTIVRQTYLEQGTTAFTNTNAIPAGQDGMWDFALTMSADAVPGDYCVRVSSANNSALNSYSQVAQITVPDPTLEQSSYGFYENVDTGGSTASYSVGDTGPAGGIIFYIDGTTYYEAAPSDQGQAEWGCYGTDINGANGAVFGTGEQNTVDIEGGCNTSGTAADLATNYSLNGYNDWFLPSNNELDQLRMQKSVVGGFSDGIYWSSTELSAFEANYVYLGPPPAPFPNLSKNINHDVRAVRTFDSSEVNSGPSVGSSLAAQDTAVTIAPNTPFRLRQLIKQTTGTTTEGNSFKLQAGEKVTTCSMANFSDIGVTISTGYQDTAGSVTEGGGGTYSWNNLPGAAADDGDFASVGGIRSVSDVTNLLIVTDFGLAIPANATITGIEVGLESLPAPVSSGNNTIEAVHVVKNNSALTSINRATGESWDLITFGSSTDLWGQAWTASDINSSGFGFAVQARLSGDMTDPSAYLDTISVNIHYILPEGVSFHDNITSPDDATIAASVNDPVPGSGSVISQTYNEDSAFTNTTAIPSGDNGLWDFSLIGGASLDGKTMCFRVVATDGTPLDSYAHYPEVTFGSQAPLTPTPTLEQMTRGGQSVINGVKTPFSW